MSYVYTTLGVLFVLLTSTIFHEYGHFWTSRLFGIRVNEFAVGLGPVLMKKKDKHGTQFSLRLFLIGGFCTMNDDDFDKLPRWKRAVIMSMGCIHNTAYALLPLVTVSFIRKGIEGVITSLQMVGNVFSGVLEAIPAIFHPSTDTVIGPVGFISTVEGMTTGMTATQALVFLVAGITAINIVLAVFNLLPIPALDGGQILFLGIDYVFEKITGYGIPKRVLAAINAGFFALIMGYSIILLFADLWLPLFK